MIGVTKVQPILMLSSSKNDVLSRPSATYVEAEGPFVAHKVLMYLQI